MQLYQLFNFILIGIFLFSCSEILTGNCSNLYSKRRHYSCYWTEYLIVEELTLLQLFTKPILAHLPSADSFFEMSQTICLFYLISPRQLELKCCGDNPGKHIIDETQSLDRISKPNKNLPNCLQIRWKVENMTCVTWRLVRLRYQIFPEDKKHFGDTQWPL